MEKVNIYIRIALVVIFLIILCTARIFMPGKQAEEKAEPEIVKDLSEPTK